MSISRKQFLRNTGLLFGGATLLRQNIFAEPTQKRKLLTSLESLFNLEAFEDLTSDSSSLPFNGNQLDELHGVNYANTIANKDAEYEDTDPDLDDCGDSPPCRGMNGNTVYDVHYPIQEYYDALLEGGYETCPLPVVIYVHGGGFSDCHERASNERICKEYAKRGFICVNLEYRRGQIHDDETDPPLTSAQQELAVYRAAQDVRGATRHIIENADAFEDFKINPNYIFLAGESAGSVATLLTAYYPTQTMLNDICPKKSGGSNPRVKDVLGDIDGDKDADSDGDMYNLADYDAAYLGKIRGVLNQWGGMSIPASFLTSNDAWEFFADNNHFPPVISFHGEDDEKFFITERPTNFSTTGVYSQESNCFFDSQTFKTENIPDNDDLTTYGSQYIYERILTQLPTPPFCELYIDTTMKHGYEDDLADFGIGTNDTIDVQNYIVGRAAVFFQTIIINKEGDLIDNDANSVFIDCKNNRIAGYLDSDDEC